MNAILLMKFLLLLVFYQLSGELLFQFNQKLFGKKINNYSLLEHFLFSLIFGIMLNTLFSLVVVYFIPFKFWILIVINSIFLIIAFVINNFSFSGLFYIRLYQNIKLRKNFKQNSEFRRNFIPFILIISLLFLMFQIILTNNNHPQIQDIYVYLHHSLDAIRNGWNLYDPNYLGSSHSTKLFTFLLIPFLSLDPANWVVIISKYMYGLQFFLLFLISYSICYRLNKKSNMIIFPIFLAGIYLSTWFYYVLPTNWNIILILMLAQFLYNEKLKSPFLAIVILIFGLFLHFATILFIAIPLVITFIIKFVKNPTSFKVYNVIKAKKKNQRRKILIFLIFGIIIIILIIVLLLLKLGIWELYMAYSRGDLKNVDIIHWHLYSIGFFPLIVIYILIFSNFVFKKKKIKNQHYVFLFFLILNIYLTIYLSNVGFWSQIIHSLYLPYRFFVYHNFTYIILTPFSVFLLNNSDFNLSYYINSLKVKFQRFNQRFQFNFLLNFKFFKSINYYIRKRTKIKIRKRGLILIILIITLLPKIISNINTGFQFNQFSNYLPNGYIDSFNALSNQDLENKTYCFNPISNIGTVNWNLFHTYLGDTRCVDLDEVAPILNDSVYSGKNSNNYTEYLNFKEYIFNSTKNIYSYAAVYKNLPEELRICIKMNYIFLDNFTNPNLVNFILNDQESFSVFSVHTSEFFSNVYHVYVFIPEY